MANTIAALSIIILATISFPPVFKISTLPVLLLKV